MRGDFLLIAHQNMSFIITHHESMLMRGDFLLTAHQNMSFIITHHESVCYAGTISKLRGLYYNLTWYKQYQIQ